MSKQNTLRIQTSSNSNSNSGTLLGLKWYYWIAIVCVFLFVYSLITSLFNGRDPVSAILDDLIGAAGALLAALSKSPLIWLGVVLWLGPAVLAGVGKTGSKMWEIYDAHEGPDKTTKEKAEKAKVDPKSLQDRIDQWRKQNPDKTARDAINEFQKNSVERVYNTWYESYYTEMKARYDTAEGSAKNAINQEYQDAVRDAQDAAEEGGADKDELVKPKEDLGGQ